MRKGGAGEGAGERAGGVCVVSGRERGWLCRLSRALPLAGALRVPYTPNVLEREVVARRRAVEREQRARVLSRRVLLVVLLVEGEKVPCGRARYAAAA